MIATFNGVVTRSRRVHCSEVHDYQHESNANFLMRCLDVLRMSLTVSGTFLNAIVSNATVLHDRDTTTEQH